MSKFVEEPCKLKSSIIDLESTEGQRLYEDIRRSGKYYQPFLHRIFTKQNGQANCGLLSVALVMSSSVVGANQHRVDDVTQDLPYTEGNMFGYKQTTDVLGTKGGRPMALSQLALLLNAHYPDSSRVYFADQISLERFREICKSVLSHSDSSSGIIVNFSQSALGRKGKWWGHHTPLAGYHQETDRLLVLDVSTGSENFWISTADLYACIKTKDHGTGSLRGCCMFGVNKDHIPAPYRKKIGPV